MNIDLANFRFHSSDHIRFQDGQDISGHNYGSNRGIEIKEHPLIAEAYFVTIYNLNGNHPFWGDNIQMGAKQMEVVNYDDDKIVLRGFGYDRGVPFSDYGLTIYLTYSDDEEVLVKKVVLHMYHRNIRIEYYK